MSRSGRVTVCRGHDCPRRLRCRAFVDFVAYYRGGGLALLEVYTPTRVAAPSPGPSGCPVYRMARYPIRKKYGFKPKQKK